MSQPNTKTITSKDVYQSKKMKNQSLILGYKVHTVTMHAEGQQESLINKCFEAFLQKIEHPVKQDDEEKKST